MVALSLVVSVIRLVRIGRVAFRVSRRAPLDRSAAPIADSAAIGERERDAIAAMDAGRQLRHSADYSTETARKMNMCIVNMFIRISFVDDRVEPRP